MSEDKKLVNVLTNESVVVRRIPRYNNGIQDKRHPLYGGMLENAVNKVAPKMLRNGQYTNILTKDEKEFLEDCMEREDGDGLSVYNKKFWDDFYVLLGKDDTRLNLSDPIDFIKYKVLVTHTDLVAPNIESMHNKASYKYVLIRQNDEDNQAKAKISKRSRAYIKYGNIESDKASLMYVIKLITGRVPSGASKLLTLQNKVGELVDEQYDNFLKIVDDNDFKTKVFIDAGLRAGAIIRRGDEFYTAENKAMLFSGDKATVDQAVRFLNSPENQEIKFAIEARIEAAKE